MLLGLSTWWGVCNKFLSFPFLFIFRSPQIFMECPPCARYMVKKTRSCPFYRVLIFYGGEQTQTKENKLTISDSGNTTKETKWANVMGEEDYLLLSGQGWPLWGGDFWVITWMMNRNQLCEGSGEEHSIKKRQAKTVEDEKRPVGSGCHELGEGWRHLNTCCLLLYSVLLLLTTPFSLSPFLAQAYRISLRQLLSLHLLNSQTSESPGYCVFLKVWLLAKIQFYFHLVWKI